MAHSRIRAKPPTWTDWCAWIQGSWFALWWTVATTKKTNNSMFITEDRLVDQALLAYHSSMLLPGNRWDDEPARSTIHNAAFDPRHRLRTSFSRVFRPTTPSVDHPRWREKCLQPHMWHGMCETKRKLALRVYLAIEQTSGYVEETQQRQVTIQHTICGKITRWQPRLICRRIPLAA